MAVTEIVCEVPGLIQLTEGWQMLDWKALQRNVYRLQRRIYQAARRGDFSMVRNLQRLLLRAYSARCIAVRQVTQDNRGKRTPGVDGKANLTPSERMDLVDELKDLTYKADPVRRVYIDKLNGEQRALGIPTMRDRALQALVKLVLEPEWEAKFEGNSYGFRPGRSTWDAIKAILNYICRQPKFVLDADIEKCFDRIKHEILLEKLKSLPGITALIRGWLKAGVVDENVTIHPEAGTPQGGVISPLLMNVALHGFETYILSCLPKSRRPAVIRYADDLVILHPDLATIQMLKEKAEAWLATIGLNLKASKTRITHTLNAHEGNLGFDFLGFTVRQFKVSKYHSQKGYKTFIRPSKANQKRQQAKLKEHIYKHRGTTQHDVTATLNPKIRGWANYYRACCAKQTFVRMDAQLHYKLWRWASWRHHNKGRKWRFRRYWRHLDGRFTFTDGHKKLARFADTKIVRHPKVPADKSPFDGDWIYWVKRIGKAPDRSALSVRLLNTQHGKCRFCKLPFTSEDILEVHHINGNHQDNRFANRALMHGHCHDQVHNDQMARLRNVRQQARQVAATS